jgi:uncharacterized membrane protein
MNKLYFGALLSLLSLITLNLVWELFYNPLDQNGSWMALKAMILIIPLPGILKKNRYTYQWSSMFILLFFIEGIMRFFSETNLSKYLALSEIIFSFIFFISTIFYCKLSKNI